MKIPLLTGNLNCCQKDNGSETNTITLSRTEFTVPVSLPDERAH